MTLLFAYLLFVLMGVNPWLSFVGALATGLCSYNFVIAEAGHDNKLIAIAFFPLVAAGVLLAYEKKKYLLGGAVFAIGFCLELMSNHVQMTYYLGLALAIYVLIHFVNALRKGDLPSFTRASLVLLVGFVLALGANANRLWTSYEYMKNTIRGPQVLVKEDGNNNSGLDKDYVFQWSHGIAETITFLIPGAYGGASQESIDENSAFFQSMVKKGVPRKQLQKAPLYWGDLPFTSGPVYFGAILCFLFVLGLLIVKGELKWWLLFATILALLLSFGKNLMWFSDIFYQNFPLYSKFRAVSSILVTLQLTIPFLGILALDRIVKGEIGKKELLRSLYISTGVVGGICLLMALMGGGFFDFSGANDANYKQAGYNVKALIEDRQSLLRSDALRSLMFVLLGAATIWVYANEKIKGNWKKYVLFGGLGLLMLIDLGGIGKRYLNSENFVRAKKYDNNFIARQVDKQIQQDKSPNYRVFDVSISTFNSNLTTNHHKTIGGYHAAKLRRYQDMIERHIGKGNQKVLNMLNAKYFITRDQKAQQNPEAMGHAWFVQNVQKVNTPNAEIDALDTIDPKTTAAVHQEFDGYLGGFSGGNAQGTIQLSDYKPNHLTYKTNSAGEQLAVFSEVWYNPSKSEGWQAYLDGQAVDHMRANYILRAMKVPSGEHTVEFKFYPRSYYMGEKTSMVFSGLLILMVLAFIAKSFMDGRKEEVLA